MSVGAGWDRQERVVLLDESGAAVGTAPKAEVHHTETPLHLAFSCYVFDGAEPGPSRLLLTRRAAAKPTWGGVWTNSCCGHPAPGEPLDEAVRRRVRQELGFELASLRLVLPAFRYRAVMDTGVVENEMCPVFVATATGEPQPHPAEVAEAAWVAWGAFRADVLTGRRAVSPWCAEQVAALPADPLAAEPASDAALPPAARTGR